MAVYVDRLFKTEPTKRWPYKNACHLTANELWELHYFAGRLRLRSDWYQNTARPHYDLTAGKRQEAVKLGAIEK